MSLNKNNKYTYLLIFFTIVINAQKNNINEKTAVLTQELEKVVVTATRTKKLISSVAMPVEIVSKKEIQQINAMRLNEVLEEQTGLITVPDYGGAAGVQMQGLDSQYTLILIDGVPLIGRTAGSLDINRISVGNIAQIEIVKGASSSLYGNDALGGVINIITEKPIRGTKVNMNYRGDSFNTHDFNSTIAIKKGDVSISAFINRYQNAGYDLNKTDDIKTIDPYVNHTFNTTIIYKINNKLRLNVSSRIYNQEQEYVPTANLKGKENANEWNNHLVLKYKENENFNGLFDFYITNYKTNSYLNNTDTNSLDSESYFDQLLVKPELRIVYKTKYHSEIVGGIGLNYETLDRTDFSTKPFFSAPYVFLQYDKVIGKRTNVILGARFDNHNKYKSQFSPKFAINYKANNHLNLKGSVGYGFKAPDFRQLYFDFTNNAVGYTVVGYNAVKTVIPRLEQQGQINNIIVPISYFDNKLNAENSLSINFGANFKASSLFSLSANVFKNNIKNLIDTRVIANKTNGQNVFSYYNIHDVYTQGIEINTTLKPSQQLKIKAGYQYLIAKDESVKQKFKNGNVFARDKNGSSFLLARNDYFGLFNRSKHMVNLKFYYNIPAWKLDTNLRTTYRSKYGISDTNDNGYLDKYDRFIKGYAIADFAINKNIAKHYKLGFGIDNITNFKDAQNISNIPGRIIYGKINIQF